MLPWKRKCLPTGHTPLITTNEKNEACFETNNLFTVYRQKSTPPKANENKMPGTLIFVH